MRKNNTTIYQLIDFAKLTSSQLGWFAGFLDGDGHIGCRIKKRGDYRYGFQLVPEVSFTQKTTRAVMLFQYMQYLFQDMGANPRERNSEFSSVMSYEITDIKQVEIILRLLMPFLIIKRKQAKYCLDIIQQYNQGLADPKLFVQLCRKADRIASLNDSKKRKNTHIEVIENLKKKKLI